MLALNMRMMLLMVFALAAVLMAAMTPSPADAAPSAWTVACDNPQTCRIQTSITNDQNQAVAMLALRKQTPDGKRLGELILPLGLHIPSGVVVKIDDGEAFPAQLVACGPGGCHAVFEATALVVAAMRDGYDFKTLIVNARNQQGVELTFSLVGFTAANTELSAR